MRGPGSLLASFRSSIIPQYVEFDNCRGSSDEREVRMAKRKSGAHDSRDLFREEERLLTRRVRRQRALYSPHFLREAASSLHLKGHAQDRAYAAVLHWADLESKGHLPNYKET